jgi:nucleotide-binding universal stress UspA family protein
MGTGYDYVVVVGIDGSAASLRALEWGVERAAEQDGMVLAITAWRSDLPNAGLRDDENAQLGPKQRAAALLTRAVEAVTCPVPVAGEVVEGRAADVLRAASRDADLLVLGSHGQTRQLRPVLGQVAAECASVAYCPVVVVPLLESGTEEPVLRSYGPA